MEYKFFPHDEYRPFQEEGMEAIRVSAVRGIPLLFSSPTGTGKTAMVYGGILEARMDDEKLAVITRADWRDGVSRRACHKVQSATGNMIKKNGPMRPS